MNLRSFIQPYSGTRDFGTLVAIDIDETIFKTFAEIKVIKDGKEIKSLTNQEFNTYKLDEGESFDFREFRNAELFKNTSIPIPKTIERIKRMMKGIMEKGSPDVILLTARADFDDKHTFLQTFRENDIPIDDIYVERAGNMTTGTTDERKKAIITKYLMTGKYTDIKLIDDDHRNVLSFSRMGKCLDQEIYDRVREVHQLANDDMVTIHFFPLLVDEDGDLKRVW